MGRKSDDPFERAVMRESRMRGWAETMTTREGMVRFLTRWLLALGLAWAGLLVAHWLLFHDPRWLVVAHSVGFALIGGYSLAGLVFMNQVLRRLPQTDRL